MERGVLLTNFNFNGQEYKLTAERTHPEGEAWRIGLAGMQ